MKQLNIDSCVIKALVLVAAKDDIRPYLNGVYINPREGHAVATDGHSLVAVKLPQIIDADDIIIPIDVCKLIAKKNEPISIKLDENVITCKLGKIGFAPIEGDYPNYKRIVPPLNELEKANHISHMIDHSIYLTCKNLLHVIQAINLLCTTFTCTQKHKHI